MERIEHPLPPIFRESSRILLLGTMPSPASRAAGFYYGHPQNRFWRVLAAVYGEAMPAGNEEKTRLILSHDLALWDVLKRCEISGASDASIRAPEPNDIRSLIEKTAISRVLCTGHTAASLYEKLVLPGTGLPCLRLPSTSPANCRVSFAALVSAYSGALRG